MVKPQTLRGFRDFLPEEMVIREQIINTLKEVYMLYGFEPLETPALEYTQTLLKKYGQEAERLIYNFKDKGQRDVGLRYDLTVPLARVMALNPNLPLPFKRYQIQPVWRADKPQAGRYREFLQADIDLVGPSSPLADAELIACLLSVVEKLGIKNYRLLINDRRLFEEYGLKDPEILKELDKIPPPYQNKINNDQIISLLKKKKVLTKKTDEKKLEKILGSLEPKSIKEIKGFLETMDLNSKKLKFWPGLTRGLDYYTGTIFELFVKGYKNLSVGGGGRYDGLVGMFLGKKLPAVGFSFGIDRLVEAMESQDLTKNIPTTKTRVLVTIFSPELLKESVRLAGILRGAGVKTDLYPDADAKLEKQLKYADKKGIPLVAILGPDEVKEKKVMIKDMVAKTQTQLSLEALLEKIG